MTATPTTPTTPATPATPAAPPWSRRSTAAAGFALGAFGFPVPVTLVAALSFGHLVVALAMATGTTLLVGLRLRRRPVGVALLGALAGCVVGAATVALLLVVALETAGQVG